MVFHVVLQNTAVPAEHWIERVIFASGSLTPLSYFRLSVADAKLAFSCWCTDTSN